MYTFEQQDLVHKHLVRNQSSLSSLKLNINVFVFSGQKATKHKEADNETSPSPRKSPKRSKHRSHSASKEHTPSHSDKSSPVDPGGGQTYSDIEKAISPVKRQTVGVIPKNEPSRISMEYDQKENIPEQNISRSPPKVNGFDNIETVTPVKQIDTSISNHFPQATSTPAPNGIISTGQSNGHAFGRFTVKKVNE